MSRPNSPPLWVWEGWLALGEGPHRVLMALWSFADYDSDGDVIVWPSMAAISQRCRGLDDRQIRRHIASLKELGLVSETGGTRGRGAKERVLHWHPAPCQGGSCNPGDTTRGGGSYNPGGEGHTTRPGAGDTTRGGGSYNPVTPGDTTRRTLQGPCSDLPGGTLHGDLRARAPEDDDRLKRHREIQAEQETVRHVSAVITREHVEAIRNAGDLWACQLEIYDWRKDLEARIKSEKLTPERVATILAAWNRQVEELGGVLEASPRMERGGDLPPERGVWWTTWRQWRADALGIKTAPPVSSNRRTGPALSTAEAHHQRAVEAGEARRAAAPKRDPDEVAREAAMYAAIFEGAEDML